MNQYDHPLLDPLVHCIVIAACFNERIADGNTCTEERLDCPCPHDDCDRKICSTCSSSECKRPGRCIGVCAECGARCSAYLSVCPLKTLVYFNSFCSQACSDISWKRADDAGLVVNVGDLAPEQLNELFNNSGLQLRGVGPRMPS